MRVFDNRVLGGGRFLESLVKRGVFVSSNPEKVFADLATQVADHFGLEPSTVEMPGSPALYRQKAVICYMAVRHLGVERDCCGRTAGNQFFGSQSCSQKRGQTVARGQ